MSKDDRFDVRLRRNTSTSWRLRGKCPPSSPPVRRHYEINSHQALTAEHCEREWSAKGALCHELREKAPRIASFLTSFLFCPHRQLARGGLRANQLPPRPAGPVRQRGHGLQQLPRRHAPPEGEPGRTQASGGRWPGNRSEPGSAKGDKCVELSWDKTPKKFPPFPNLPAILEKKMHVNSLILEHCSLIFLSRRRDVCAGRDAHSRRALQDARR